MKKYRLLAILFACVIILQSCGIITVPETSEKETTDDAVTDTKAPEKEPVIDTRTSAELKVEADKALAELQVTDASGMRLTVAVTDSTFISGDGEETALTSDRVTRIAKIENKLHASISVQTYTIDNLIKNLRAAAKKKETFADVIAIPLSYVGQLASEGLIKSVRYVPRFNIDGKGYYDDGMEALTAGNELYGVIGDGVFEPEKIYGIYYNKTVAEELGINLNKCFTNGDFTVDKFSYYLRLASEKGYSGIVVKTGFPFKRAILSGSGYDFTVNKLDKTPHFDTFTEDFEMMCRTLKYMPDADYSTAPRVAFSLGKTLFMIDTVDKAEIMADSIYKWGLLPFPRKDENAAYSAYISDNATVLCIPVYASDDETAGDFIEALNAASYGYIKYDYIYHNMLHVLPDNYSVNSLNYIINNVNYDFCTCFSSGYPKLKELSLTEFDNVMEAKTSLKEHMNKEDAAELYLREIFAAYGD